jgi:5'(3')-deoxyribonucleotidase
MMKTILIDVDGVLRDLMPSMIKSYKKHFDPASRLRVSDIKTFSLDHHFPKCNFWIELVNMHGKEFFMKSKPIQHNINALNKLIKKYKKDIEFVICSHQTPETAQYTNDWLTKHKVNIDRRIYTVDKYLVRAHMLIDDGPPNLYKFQSSTNQELSKTSICVTQPWNKNEWNGLRINHLGELDPIISKLF